MLEPVNPSDPLHTSPSDARSVSEMVRDAAGIVVAAGEAPELAEALCGALCDRIEDPSHWIVAHIGVEIARHAGRLSKGLLKKSLDCLPIAELRDLHDACALAAEMLDAHIARNSQNGKR